MDDKQKRNLLHIIVNKIFVWHQRPYGEDSEIVWPGIDSVEKSSAILGGKSLGRGLFTGLFGAGSAY